MHFNMYVYKFMYNACSNTVTHVITCKCKFMYTCICQFVWACICTLVCMYTNVDIYIYKYMSLQIFVRVFVL